jgi:DNA mismatch repair ATPase MutS
MEKWKEQHAAEMEKWFEVIADFDALCGLANVSYNNPHWTFPQLSDDNTYKMNQIRHPLMKTETCVPNDFEVNKVPALQVITGANMAGKSTYLRTIGSNMILAMVGAPVHASAMIFTPIKLISSLRTTDSLAKSESYFYAEIKRLQMIVNRLKRGEKMLILLDEILKGTNSKDKEQGSRQLLLQLLKLKAIGIIATHDISLGEMSKTHGEWISNQCFEVDIMDDQLVFDYRIRSGVAQNMNASFLLKKMGITA